MNILNRRLLLSLLLIPITLWLTGCKTTSPHRPLTQNEIKQLLSRPKDPRSLYLSVFEGPAGPEFENAHRLHLDHFAQLNLHNMNDQPGVIKVSGISSTLYTALIDPSTPESWVAVRMKHEIPLTPLGSPYYHVEAAHLADVDSGFIAHASTIKLDALRVDSALFAMRNNAGDLGPFARGVTPLPDIILGHQFFANFRFVQFNFPAKKAAFSSTKEYEVPGARLLAKLPLHIIDGALGTEASIRGKKTKVILDLAGNYHLAHSQPIETTQIYLEDLALRGLEVENSSTLGLTDSPFPRIGWKALRSFVITLDYHRRVIWFERP